MKREMGLDYLWESTSFSLLKKLNKFSDDCLPQPIYFQILPDFSLTFQAHS